MATAFSTANMKAEFSNIRLACSQLIEVLKTVGPDEVVDMDNALCRESLDVIGGVLLCPKLAACLLRVSPPPPPTFTCCCTARQALSAGPVVLINALCHGESTLLQALLCMNSPKAWWHP